MEKDFQIELSPTGEVTITDTSVRQLNARDIENEIYRVEEDMKFLKTQAAAIQRDWNNLKKKKDELEKVQAQINDEVTLDGDLFEEMK